MALAARPTGLRQPFKGRTISGRHGVLNATEKPGACKVPGFGRLLAANSHLPSARRNGRRLSAQSASVRCWTIMKVSKVYSDSCAQR